MSLCFLVSDHCFTQMVPNMFLQLLPGSHTYLISRYLQSMPYFLNLSKTRCQMLLRHLLSCFHSSGRFLLLVTAPNTLGYHRLPPTLFLLSQSTREFWWFYLKIQSPLPAGPVYHHLQLRSLQLLSWCPCFHFALFCVSKLSAKKPITLLS